MNFWEIFGRMRQRKKISGVPFKMMLWICHWFLMKFHMKFKNFDRTTGLNSQRGFEERKLIFCESCCSNLKLALTGKIRRSECESLRVTNVPWVHLFLRLSQNREARVVCFAHLFFLLFSSILIFIDGCWLPFTHMFLSFC